MFGTGLVRKEDEFLRTVAVGVDVGDDLRPDSFEIIEAVIDDLDVRLLLVSEGDAGVFEQFDGMLAGAVAVHGRAIETG